MHRSTTAKLFKKAESVSVHI